MAAAAARGDAVEGDRLARSAPRMDCRVPDYWGLCEGLEELATLYLLRRARAGRAVRAGRGPPGTADLFVWPEAKPASAASAPGRAGDAGAPLRDVGRRLEAALRGAARRSGGRAGRQARPRRRPPDGGGGASRRLRREGGGRLPAHAREPPRPRETMRRRLGGPVASTRPRTWPGRCGSAWRRDATRGDERGASLRARLARARPRRPAARRVLHWGRWDVPARVRR